MEPLIKHQNMSRHTAKERAVDLLKLVGIPKAEIRVDQYPHQFSGGMRQRVVIAIALACNPKVLIADEPTTALDVTIQAQILELMKDLQKKIDTSIIFITHDLGVVANVADRVAVMYGGKIVEIGTADEIFYNPQHPYTWGLISSMPDMDTNDEELFSIPGTPPDLLDPPKGDAFAPRNPFVMKIDLEQEPPFFKVSDTHYAATWLLHPDAPKVNPPEAVKRRQSQFAGNAPVATLEKTSQGQFPGKKEGK
ncbi:MAG: ABC transporter ATP-binding protein, partial [Bacillus sp. (in: firmicutes)]